MSTLSYAASRLPEPVSKGHSNLSVGTAIAKSVSGASARLWAAFIAMQEARAQDYAMPCLAQMSPDQLKELGYTPSDIKAIDSHRHMTPPYWV